MIEYNLTFSSEMRRLGVRLGLVDLPVVIAKVKGWWVGIWKSKDGKNGREWGGEGK
jgi:hypothetical protein